VIVVGLIPQGLGVSAIARRIGLDRKPMLNYRERGRKAAAYGASAAGRSEWRVPASHTPSIG
jgi:hypothetical protein